MLLARLAVDEKEQGNGLGPDLLLDAELRVLRAAKNVGARTLLVHALDERRADFYKKYGYLPLLEPLTLHKPLAKIEAAAKEASAAQSKRDGEPGEDNEPHATNAAGFSEAITKEAEVGRHQYTVPGMPRQNHLWCA
jgi:hypothetical protein